MISRYLCGIVVCIDEYGMFDDEVRYLAEGVDEVQVDARVAFLTTPDDYQRLRQTHAHVAVLFTVKWDPTSKLARRAFHQIAAAGLTDLLTLIDVDCFDWTEICDREAIFEWPTLLLFEKGTGTMYEGSTNADEMASFLIRSAVRQPYHIVEGASSTQLETLLKHQQVIILARIQHEEELCKSNLRTGSMYCICLVYETLTAKFADDDRIFFMFQFCTER
jgi:hypothetical protein